MVRQQQPRCACQHGLHACVEQLRWQRVVPQPARHGGQHHQPDRHQGAQGLKTRHQVDDDQHQKALLPEPAAPSGGAQKHRVKAFQHQPAVHRGQQQQADAGHAGHHQKALAVHTQRAAKQDVQQVQLSAVARDQHHAQRQRHQVKGGQAGVFLERGEACDQPGDTRDQHARQHAAQGHGSE